jgi:hypothetical protein
MLTEDVPPLSAKCMKLVADRRANPTEDMLSVLVFAEIDGDVLADEQIFAGQICSGPGSQPSLTWAPCRRETQASEMLEP